MIRWQNETAALVSDINKCNTEHKNQCTHHFYSLAVFILQTEFRAESKLRLKGEDCGTVYNIFLYFFILIKKRVKIILLNKMCDNHKLLFSTDLISWKMFWRKIPLTFCQRKVDAQKKKKEKSYFSRYRLEGK